MYNDVKSGTIIFVWVVVLLRIELSDTAMILCKFWWLFFKYLILTPLGEKQNTL